MISGFHLWYALVGLYILESVRLTAPGVMLFTKRFTRRNWSGTFPYGGPAAGRSWTLLPLYPAEAVIILQDFVFVCDPVCFAQNAAFVRGTPKIHRWSDILKAMRDDRDVRVDNLKFFTCSSSAQATLVTGFIERLRTMPEEERAGAIEAWVRTAFAFDVQDKLARFRDATKIVRRLSAMLWFVAGPLLAAALLIVKNDAVLLPALILMEALGISIAFATVRAKRRLTNDGPRRFPWASLKYGFYPVAALRAQDDLAEGLFAGIHPMVLCAELCTGEQRVTLLRNLYLAMLYPARADVDTAENAIEWFYRTALRQAETLLAAKAPEVLKTLTPERRDDTCLAWCPRCLAQYQLATGICSDCPGIDLRPFTAPPKRNKRGSLKK